jgi:hypothetical protein
MRLVQGELGSLLHLHLHHHHHHHHHHRKLLLHSKILNSCASKFRPTKQAAAILSFAKLVVSTFIFLDTTVVPCVTCNDALAMQGVLSFNGSAPAPNPPVGITRIKLDAE